MSQPQPILLYDYLNKTGTTLSPNVWKVRLSLEYKKLPYSIVFVELPDIANACKQIGAPPSGVREDGSPHYTVPAIHDPNTGAAISDSAKIVRYLDKMYPETPRLVPKGTSALHAAFDAAFMTAVLPALLPLLAPALVKVCTPLGAAVVRAHYEGSFREPLEHFASPEVREEFWPRLEDAYRKVETWKELEGSGGPYIMGEQVSYADITVAAFVLGPCIVFGEGHGDAARLEAFGQRWVDLLKFLPLHSSTV